MEMEWEWTNDSTRLVTKKGWKGMSFLVSCWLERQPRWRTGASSWTTTIAQCQRPIHQSKEGRKTAMVMLNDSVGGSNDGSWSLSSGGDLHEYSALPLTKWKNEAKSVRGRRDKGGLILGLCEICMEMSLGMLWLNSLVEIKIGLVWPNLKKWALP